MRRVALGLLLLLFSSLSSNAFATRPSDFVAQQLSLHQIRAVEAWSYATGSRSVVVAILDTGIDLDHPELLPNLWTNPGEIAGNGLDDDGDGYADDVHGWNFRDGTGDVEDHLGRGTHIAGVIGASGDNAEGIAGICWKVSLLPIKVMKDEMVSGGVDPAVGAEAIRYAADRGASVILVDFVTGRNDATLKSSIVYAISKGAVVVAAAGDGSADLDRHPVYPAAWQIPGFLSVANVDQGAKLALSSNFGSTTVTLVAPGVNVFSTLPGGFVGRMTGTAQAAAHVAGAAALMKSYHPALTALEIATAIETLSSNRGILKGKVKTEGILDLGLLIAEKRQTVDAHITAPAKVKVGQVVDFDGSTSEGPIVEYLWKFGDPDDQFGKIVPHKWDRPGKVGVELQVRTADGRTASIDREIEIVGEGLIPGVCSVGSRAGSPWSLAAPLVGLGLIALRRRGCKRTI